jgi:hypothetical protein
MSKLKELVTDIVQMYDGEGKCIGQIAAILDMDVEVVKQIVKDHSDTWVDVQNITG